jgi:hypothetical protein
MSPSGKESTARTRAVHAAPHLMQRHFSAQARNVLWVADARTSRGERREPALRFKCKPR